MHDRQPPAFGRRPTPAVPPPRAATKPPPLALKQAEGPVTDRGVVGQSNQSPHIEPATEPWPLDQENRQDSGNTATEYAGSASPQPRRPASSQHPMVIAGFGFLAGAVFWHAVGFWSIVHEAVFSGPRQSAAIERSQPAQAAPAASSVPAQTATSSAAQRQFDERSVREFTRSAPNGSAPITTGAIPGAAPATAPITPQQASPPPQPAAAGTGTTSQADPFAWQPAVTASQ